MGRIACKYALKYCGRLEKPAQSTGFPRGPRLLFDHARKAHSTLMSLRAARLLVSRAAAPVAPQALRRRAAPTLAVRWLSDRGAPPPTDLPVRGAPPPKALEPFDWHPVVDPETQGTYYHNPMTGVVTAVGAEKPAWEPVEAEGGIYWWNVDTDETSAVGEPCPAIQPAAQNGQVPQQQGGSPLGQPQQGGGMMSGLGQTMAQGMAFGAGSSVAHSVMGSMFGGGGSSDASPMDNSPSDSYDGGDSYDGDDGGGGDDWA